MKIHTQLVGLMVVVLCCANTTYTLKAKIENAAKTELDKLKAQWPEQTTKVADFQKAVATEIKSKFAKFDNMSSSKEQDDYCEEIREIGLNENDPEYSLYQTIANQTIAYLRAANEEERAKIIDNLHVRINIFYNKKYIPLFIKNNTMGEAAAKEFAQLKTEDFKKNIALLKNIFKQEVLETAHTYLTGHCFNLTLNANDSYKKMFRDEMGRASKDIIGKSPEDLLRQALAVARNNILYNPNDSKKQDEIISEMNKKIDFVFKLKEDAESKKIYTTDKELGQLIVRFAKADATYFSKNIQSLKLSFKNAVELTMKDFEAKTDPAWHQFMRDTQKRLAEASLLPNQPEADFDLRKALAVAEYAILDAISDPRKQASIINEMNKQIDLVLKKKQKTCKRC